MRIGILFSLIFFAGCGDEPDLRELFTDNRINHRSGISVVQLRDSKLLGAEWNNFAICYPAEGRGRSKVSIGVSSMEPLTPIDRARRFTRDSFNLSEYTQIESNIWYKESTRSGTIDRPERRTVDVVTVINDRWIVVGVVSTIDLENVRDFAIQFAKSIKVEITE